MLRVNNKFPPGRQEGHVNNTAGSASSQAAESLDGTGAGDHDVPYIFGRLPRAVAPFPFSTHQFARLLILRSCFREGLIGGDTR
jgi:hypothetical protein